MAKSKGTWYRLSGFKLKAETDDPDEVIEDLMEVLDNHFHKKRAKLVVSVLVDATTPNYAEKE